MMYATSHKTFFDDFQTDSQASSPNDVEGEPSGRNLGFKSDSDDTSRDQPFDNDQESMQIGEEDFSEGNNFENFMVLNLLFNTRESNTLRRSSKQSKLPSKLNDYVLNSKARSLNPNNLLRIVVSVQRGSFSAENSVVFITKEIQRLLCAVPAVPDIFGVRTAYQGAASR
nr:hypothetical protein [Tanacetum cinerariifolium]